jgi:iron complex transport system ATP-binding protein
VLVQAADLQFRYRVTPVIDGVSLDVARGAILGILGPNGSGKTTLIKLLSGALAPAAGGVRLDGVPLARLARAAVARRMAIVPQDTHLAFDYTALEIVLMGRYPRLGTFEIEGPLDIQSAMDALHATGTDALASRLFTTLSGGERQRVVIASALAQLDDRDPRRAGARAPASVLFLDEPTASLDLRYQLELADLVRRLNRDRVITVILSTHDLRLASSICTEVVLLSGGRVASAGAPRDLLTSDRIASLYGVDRRLVPASFAQ